MNAPEKVKSLIVELTFADLAETKQAGGCRRCSRAAYTNVSLVRPNKLYRVAAVANAFAADRARLLLHCVFVLQL